MKNFKQSKTKTSKTKTSKAKTSKTKTSKAKNSKTKTSKTKTPKYFSRKSFVFVFFRDSFSLERICLTVSKSPENISGQVLSSFGHYPVCIFPYCSKTQPFLPKYGLFH